MASGVCVVLADKGEEEAFSMSECVSSGSVGDGMRRERVSECVSCRGAKAKRQTGEVWGTYTADGRREAKVRRLWAVVGKNCPTPHSSRSAAPSGHTFPHIIPSPTIPELEYHMIVTLQPDRLDAVPTRVKIYISSSHLLECEYSSKPITNTTGALAIGSSHPVPRVMSLRLSFHFTTITCLASITCKELLYS